MILPHVTLCLPYFAAPLMLQRQMEEAADYDRRLSVIVIDDASPTPAEPIVREAQQALGDQVQLWRIDTAIDWNRNGARNLAAHVCESTWMVHTDIDHVLPAASARALFETEIDPANWYRFPRFRVGAADDTRKKDSLHPSCRFGPVKPHGDSFLCTHAQYWTVGGYDEDYSGHLGGGSPFLAQMEANAPVRLLPDTVCLHVHTRDSVRDASISTLSRDTSFYSAMRKEKERTGATRAENPLRFKYHRVL